MEQQRGVTDQEQYRLKGFNGLKKCNRPSITWWRPPLNDCPSGSHPPVIIEEMIAEDDDITVFKKWLETNGAKFPKIEWPSLDTTGGVRGATAIESIATNEVMIEIPGHMMMSPPVAFASDIGALLRQNGDILRTDILLSVFIMSERSKGAESFFYPFLRILPEPGTIANWQDKDLLHIQDDALHVRAKGRLILVESTFNRTVVILSERSPNDFPLDKFSFENFKFSWFSIMARAFGKRLPWTALVPFADCLNHGNLQTKYDYDVNDNGLFRLFPSGSNFYSKGSEVFNSYGRRANDNLLLDYGFAMLDNEWDTFEIMLTLPALSPSHDLKKDILSALGYSTSLPVALNRKNFPLYALTFLRVVVMTESDAKHLLRSIPQPAATQDASDATYSALNRSAASTSRDDKRRCFNHVLSVANEVAAIQLLVSILTATVIARTTTTQDDELLLAEILSGSIEADEKIRKLYEKIDDIDNDGKGEGAPNTDDKKPSGDIEKVIENDKNDVKRCGGVEEDDKWKLQCAVIYRLTRKRIVDINLNKLVITEAFLSSRLTVDNMSNRRPDDNSVRSLSISEECPFIPLISENFKSEKSEVDGAMDVTNQPSGATTGASRASHESQDNLSQTKSPINPTPTLNERDSLTLRAELDSYITQVNSRNLRLQINDSP